MEVEEAVQALVTEAGNWKRDCLYLRPAGPNDDVVGFLWGVESVLVSDAGFDPKTIKIWATDIGENAREYPEIHPASYPHWLSVDCKWLSKHDFAAEGVMSVYGDGFGPLVGLVDRQMKLPESLDDATPVTGSEGYSLPTLRTLLATSIQARHITEALPLGEQPTEPPEVNPNMLESRYRAEHGRVSADLGFGPDTRVILGGWLDYTGAGDVFYESKWQLKGPVVTFFDEGSDAIAALFQTDRGAFLGSSWIP